MAKALSWYFCDSNKIKYCGNNSSKEQFSFKLTRYKDVETHKETLKIESFVKNKDTKKDDYNGYIITGMISLYKNIKNLMDIGVVLTSLDFQEICMVIEEKYIDLDTTLVTLNKDSRLDDLVSEIISFVKDDVHLFKDNLCFVPVTAFNEIAEDCGYSTYEMKALREQLAASKFIKTSTNTSGTRYAILERIDNKSPQRVIAFYREKLGLELPKPKETKTPNRKSDAYEK